MARNYPASALANEETIVWLIDPASTPYVREVLYHGAYGRRKGRPKWNEHPDHHLVGYAELKADAKGCCPGMFTRRTFFLKRHDRVYDPAGVYSIGTPCEAVDPLTVAPGVPGVLTERAWGRPFNPKPSTIGATT